MKRDKIVIVPSCSDLNRGDQALVWETKKIAEESGLDGDFYFQVEKNEPVKQSEKEGLHPFYPILEHPSRKFKQKHNISYSRSLKVRWGLVAVGDFLGSLLLLWTPTRILVYPFLSREKKRSLNIMRSSKAVFMKGGGLLQTYGGISSTYSMYFWTFPLLLAKHLKKPIYVMPNSFGPFEGPFVKKIAQIALKNTEVLTSRESLSQKTVGEQLGLKIENIADLAFNLPKAQMDKKVVYKNFDIPFDKQLVAITMRPYRFPLSSDPVEAYERFQQEMAKFISWLYDEGFMPVIVEHTLAVNDHENDSACIKAVTSKVEDGKYRIIADESLNCQELKTIYSYCDYIVGTRFHSMIFSFGSSVPGIAISYTGNKSTGIMHDMGLDDYVIDIGDVSFDQLKRKFEALTDNRTAVIEKISIYRNRAKKDRKKLVLECKRP